MKKILVTGAAGFIGFHLSKALIDLGHEVFGIDNLNDYYDVQLKKDRLNLLMKEQNFHFFEIDLADDFQMNKLSNEGKFEIVVNLAAQAGVQYSISNPHVYIDSNIRGFLNILELSKKIDVEHLIYASSSSVYGLNETLPFSENDNVDHPISLYAATKKSNELMAHTYSYLFNIPTTGLRFFTVYGPWGRPDMALFKFTKGIIENKKIDIYNNGKMYRDFTYIDDIVNGINLLIKKPPSLKHKKKYKNDSLSSVGPFRVLNIGNTKKVYLLNFIKEIEKELGKKAIRNYMPLQKGDVKQTLSDTSLLKSITKYNPKTNYKTGIKNFLKWYQEYYN